jgi:SAM-dependent methyltransferase
MNWDWVVQYAEDSIGPNPQGARILDYGCGAGEVVERGLSRGLDIVGVDVFFEGSNARQKAAERGLLGRSIFEMEYGHIPCPDASFDFIISNQVFEHVPDLAAVLAEIARVVKPGGKLLALFPHRSTLREPHCGVPIAHWFPKGRAQYLWLLTWRGLGVGSFKAGRGRREWARQSVEWMARFCCYRSIREIDDEIGKYFSVEHIEDRHIAFRRDRSMKWRLGMPFPASVNGVLFRNLVDSVIVATRLP